MTSHSNMNTKQYLGDSVYANFDSGVLELTTENGLPTDPGNSIIIELEVYEALVHYMDQIIKRYQES